MFMKSIILLLIFVVSVGVPDSDALRKIKRKSVIRRSVLLENKCDLNKGEVVNVEELNDNGFEVIKVEDLYDLISYSKPLSDSTHCIIKVRFSALNFCNSPNGHIGNCEQDNSRCTKFQSVNGLKNNDRDYQISLRTAEKSVVKRDVGDYISVEEFISAQFYVQSRSKVDNGIRLVYYKADGDYKYSTFTTNSRGKVLSKSISHGLRPLY